MDPQLKVKIQRIALSKGLNVTSYIKMTLIHAAEEDSDFALTQNGFTVREEKRLLKSIDEGEKEVKGKKNKVYSKMADALSSLT